MSSATIVPSRAVAVRLEQPESAHAHAAGTYGAANSIPTNAEVADTVNKGGLRGPPLERNMAVVNPQRLLRRLDWSVSKLKAMCVWLESEGGTASYKFNLDCLQQWGADAHTPRGILRFCTAHTHVEADCQHPVRVCEQSLVPGLNLPFLDT